jgi:RNA polymerase sigma-70 factor (ECF subfamily)
MNAAVAYVLPTISVKKQQPDRVKADRPAGDVVYAAGFFADDESFLEALHSGQPGALGVLFQRHADHVERVLFRVLGADSEIPDMVQDVFLRATRGIAGFRGDVAGLRAWLGGIAVNTARGWIRKRQARRWLLLREPDRMLDVPAATASPELVDVLRRTYGVLDRMPLRERVPFALRFIDEMELSEVATACDVSLATVKRRLAKARGRFERLARLDPVLCAWLDRGDA